MQRESSFGCEGWKLNFVAAKAQRASATKARSQRGLPLCEAANPFAAKHGSESEVALEVRAVLRAS